MEQLEFNSFLLHLGNELESNEFEALKFVLKGYVTSSKCEEMGQVFKYFEEMERRCLLSPTNLLVLKIAFESIGRLDLVKKIEGKEEYFATLFREAINDSNSLDSKDCDLVCDDIKEAAVHLAEFFPRSSQSTAEMHKKLRLIGGEKDIDFQLQEIAEELQASSEDELMTSATAEPSEVEENDLSHVTSPALSSLNTVETEATPLLQTGRVQHKVLGSHKVEKSLLESKTEQKNPSRETVSDGNHLKDFSTTSETPDKMKTAVAKGATSLHAMMPPSFSSVNKLDDDVVTDEGEEGNKENLRAGFNKLDEETTMNSSKQVSESDSCDSKDQMFPVKPSPLVTSNEASTTDSPVSQLQLKSYKKKGYSVAISNGSLCECTSEKGVVMMKNGTTFAIAITNSNDYAAEVDITFGGRYLGFWSVDAQQTNPLIIEGSAWEKGKLTFTSDSPECMPSSKVHPFDGVESSGKIELEFKPEAMALFVQHVRSDKKHEALLTGFKEATVDDLKEEINRSLWEHLGIVSCLIRNGKVLEEQNAVRSYSLKDGDIIQVLTNEEPISVQPLGLDAFTIRVDPRHDSCKRVMDAIAEKMSVPFKKQRLQINGEDLKETHSLATMFLKSKKPVVKVVTDMNISITVHLPSQEVKKFSIAWFATVDELKKELQLPQTDAILKLDNKEISGSGLKQLIDLGMKNGSEVTVVSAQQKENRAPATHRGVRLSSLRKPGTTRGFGGFGDFEFHASVSNTRGFSSGSRGSPDPLGEYENSDDMEEDTPMTIQRNDLPAGLREGACFLRGEELVANQFQVDTLERKFSKDKLKAVTLIIQLCSRSTV